MKIRLLIIFAIGVIGFAETIFAEESTVCGPGAVLVNDVCKIIQVESAHYVNTSPFYQSLLMFSIFLWPYFISGSAIFIVLAKTPRYKKSVRIVVALFGSLIILWFLIMMFIGIWPQMGD